MPSKHLRVPPECLHISHWELVPRIRREEPRHGSWQLVIAPALPIFPLPIFPCQPLEGFCNFRPARCCAKRKSQSIQVASPGKSAKRKARKLQTTGKMLPEIDMSQPSSGKSFSSSSKLRRACSSEWCFSRKVSWSRSCWSSVLKIHQNSSKCTTARMSNRDENKSTMFLHAKFCCIDFQTCSIWEIKSHIFSTRSPSVLQTLLVGGTDPRRFAAWVGASLNLGDVDVTSKKKQIQKFDFDSLLDINDINLQEGKFQFNFSAQMQRNFNRKKKKLPSPRHVQSFLFDVERWPLWTWHGRGSARHSAGDYAAFASLRSAPAWNNTTFPKNGKI